MHKAFDVKDEALQQRCPVTQKPPLVTVTASAARSFPFQVTGQQHPVDVSSLCPCVFFFFPPMGKDEWTQCVSASLSVSLSQLWL